MSTSLSKLTPIRYTIRGIELDASGSVSPGWFSRILEHTRWQVFAMDDFALARDGGSTEGAFRSGKWAKIGSGSIEFVAFIIVVSTVTTGEANPLIQRILADPAFGLSAADAAECLDPVGFIGRSGEQVIDFLEEVVGPALAGLDVASAEEPRV